MLTTTITTTTRILTSPSCIRRQAKRAAQEAAEAAGAMLDEGEGPTEPYTFMGYDMRSVARLAHGRGTRHFPAILTRKAGIDKQLMDLARPLFNAGVRPDRLSKIVLELHAKEHAHAAIAHEEELAASRGGGSLAQAAAPLSSFADKKGWAGLVPNGDYVAAVYKAYSNGIAKHLDAEVKKQRGARRLHWDVSYKEAKHLCQYHGKPLFKGLLTATNEAGEVRLQFQIVTDGHDQMERALQAMVETLNTLNQPQPELVATDKPFDDKHFFLRMLASLRAKQAALLSESALPATHAAGEQGVFSNVRTLLEPLC